MKLFKKKVAEPSRRQRLGGASSAPANFSYHSRRSSVSGNTGRDAQRALFSPSAKQLGNFWLQRFGLLFLLLAAGAFLISSVSLSTKPKIVSLQSANGSVLLRDPKIYQQAANKLFASSIFNRSKITVNSGHIASQLVAQFPELANATITLPLLAHRPVIYLVPEQPALVLSTSSGSYIVDTSGKALLPSARLTAADSDKLPMVIDQSGLKVEINKQVLPSNDVAFIQMVAAQLAARQFAVASMTLPASTQELDVRLLGKPFFVKFNLASSDTARQQAGTFLAVYSKLQRDNNSPAQYIDVRVAGRAYYQ